MNKIYISPEFELLRVEIIDDALTGSLETDSGNPIIGGDDWDNWGSGSDGDEDW